MRRYRNPKIFDNAQVNGVFMFFFAALRVTARHEADQYSVMGFASQKNFQNLIKISQK